MTQINADKNTKDKENYAIIDVEMTVHDEPRRGFLEVIYQEALYLDLPGISPLL